MMCVYIWINSGLMKVLWIERFWFFCLVMGIRIVIINPLGKYLLCEVEIFCYNCLVLWFGNYMWIFRIGKIRIVDCQIDWKYPIIVWWIWFYKRNFVCLWEK